MRRLAVLFLFSTLFIGTSHAEEVKILLPKIPDIVSKGPKLDIKSLGTQSQKKYLQFQKDLKKHIEIVSPILAGKMPANCKNINEKKKLLFPPAIPSGVFSSSKGFQHEYDDYRVLWYNTQSQYNKACKLKSSSHDYWKAP